MSAWDGVTIIRRFSKEFKDQVGISSNNVWNGVNGTVIYGDGGSALLRKVLRTPYSIGYSVYGDAVNMLLPIALFRQNSRVPRPISAGKLPIRNITRRVTK